LKEQKSNCSFCHSFEKSEKKSDRSFALFKRATKRVIAFSLFCREQMTNPAFLLFFRTKKEQMCEKRAKNKRKKGKK